jgi:hypothetical protein
MFSKCNNYLEGICLAMELCILDKYVGKYNWPQISNLKLL